MTPTPDPSGPPSPADICVSLEMARKLVGAGWKHRTVYTWVTDLKFEHPILCQAVEAKHWKSWQNSCGRRSRVLFVPTAEEILRRLPRGVRCRCAADDDIYDLCEPGTWVIWYEEHSDIGVPACKGDTLADASALMWLYLKEHSLLP